MVRFPTRAAAAAVFALAASLLTGCLTKDAPVTRFYVLDALPGDSAALDVGERSRPLSIDVVPARLPQYLARPQIVTRSGGNRLELAEFHQWGGNLEKNLTRVLARNLSVLLGTPDVTLFPRRPPAPADVRVEIEVMAFERGADGLVRLSAQWRLLGGGGDRVLLTRVSDLAGPAAIAAPDMEATVAAMSTLAGELSRVIATEIVARVPA